MTAVTEAATATASAREKTAYHILEEADAASLGTVYTPVAVNIRANNAEHAVRDYIASQADKIATGAVFVAVPSRAFKPIKVTVATKTVVKLDTA